MYQITFTADAESDLSLLRKYDQKRVIGAIESLLGHQVDQNTRNRKRLRPNRLAEWELRVGNLRVFYDAYANQQLIKVIAIGYKQGSKLYLHGEEYEL